MKTLIQQDCTTTNFEVFLAYRKKNPKLFENNVIISFFENPYHVQLFIRQLCEPSVKYIEFEMAFKRFFFLIRFTKYMSTLIFYSDIEYHRKRKRLEDRNPLVFDTPLGEEGDMLYGETLSMEPELAIPQPKVEVFQSSIENHKLFASFTQLTQKQKQIITLAYDAYDACVLDTEIACTFMVSQQAVSKTRIKALNKMKKELIELPYVTSTGGS